MRGSRPTTLARSASAQPGREIVCLLLVLANVRYFSWEWTRSSTPAPEGPRRDHGNILLVSEQLEEVPPSATPLDYPPETYVVAGEPSALVERLLDDLLQGHDFRVFIDLAPSFEAAFRKLRELQSQNIYSYVIAQGRYAFGISLGV